MKKHIIAVLMSVLVFTHFVMASPDTVNSEAMYNFEIKADVVEYPINWLKENNKINVPLYFTNNPGFNEISFLLEDDERIAINPSVEGKYDYMENGILNYYHSEYPNITWATNPFPEYYCDYNGEIGYIWVRVPKDSKVGDFYEIKFKTECVMAEDDIYFTKDGEFFGAENMSFVNGGVRIVEERPFYQGTYIEPSPEPEQKPDVPAGESQQDNVSENKNQSSENEQAVNHEKKEDSDIKEDSENKLPSKGW